MVVKPRDKCIKRALDEFEKVDGRNKDCINIKLGESLESDTCSLKDNEIASYGKHIDFIFINIDTNPNDMNICLDDSDNRLFFYDHFDQLNDRHGQIEALCDEICQSPTPQPTETPTS